MEQNTETKDKDYDYVKPQHYKLFNNNEDALVVIKSTLGLKGYRAFLVGNILKYQLRLGKKPNESVERDQKKIEFYQTALKKTEDNLKGYEWLD